MPIRFEGKRDLEKLPSLEKGFCETYFLRKTFNSLREALMQRHGDHDMGWYGFFVPDVTILSPHEIPYTLNSVPINFRFTGEGDRQISILSPLTAVYYD